eukprot:UN25625
MPFNSITIVNMSPSGTFIAYYIPCGTLTLKPCFLDHVKFHRDSPMIFVCIFSLLKKVLHIFVAYRSS